MEFKEVVGRRRSIRFYQPWQPVEREKIQTILEAARLASRAVNAAFAKAVVTYRHQISLEDRNALKTATTTAQIDTAPVYIFWYGDLEAVAKTNKGETLRQLVDVGALNPPLGWSHRYVNDVIWPQVLEPMTKNPAALAGMVRGEASLAICQALLAAFDEGLGSMLTAFNGQVAQRILGVPDTWMPLWLQLVGYPAESWEAGGQRPREPFEEDFFEGKYGVPFPRDAAVVESLTEAKMIQRPAPLPWRNDEIRGLARMFGLPE